MIAKLKEKHEVARGTLQVTWQLPEKISFKPGQYILYSLLHLSYEDPRGPRRFFSIVSEQTENTDTVSFVTRLRDTGFKKTIQEMEVGSEINVERVMGAFVLPDDNTIPLVFIAGGIGITPFISMIRYVVKHRTGHQITLIYSNRDRQSTAFFEELEGIAKTNQNIKVIFIMTQDKEWNGEKKHLNSELIKELIPDYLQKTFMIVGPPGMNDSVEEELKKMQISESQIKKENFSGY